jgi:hypothetical protein
MAVTRTCLSVAFLAVALPAAAQHTCAELGPRYTMYTYKSGDRVAVDSGRATRAYMVFLDCKYGADNPDLGFARLCAGDKVKVGAKTCQVSKVEALTGKPQIDPDGRLVARNSGNRARPMK